MDVPITSASWRPKLTDEKSQDILTYMASLKVTWDPISEKEYKFTPQCKKVLDSQIPLNSQSCKEAFLRLTSNLKSAASHLSTIQRLELRDNPPKSADSQHGKNSRPGLQIPRQKHTQLPHPQPSDAHNFHRSCSPSDGTCQGWSTVGLSPGSSESPWQHQLHLMFRYFTGGINTNVSTVSPEVYVKSERGKGLSLEKDTKATEKHFLKKKRKKKESRRQQYSDGRLCPGKVPYFDGYHSGEGQLQSASDIGQISCKF